MSNPTAITHQYIIGAMTRMLLLNYGMTVHAKYENQQGCNHKSKLTI